MKFFCESEIRADINSKKSKTGTARTSASVKNDETFLHIIRSKRVKKYCMIFESESGSEGPTSAKRFPSNIPVTLQNTISQGREPKRSPVMLLIRI